MEEQRSEKSHTIDMSRIGSRDTAPEMTVRRELHRRGFRFRKNVTRLPGTPDIVLSRYRTCIFVNGCFWHGHQGCKNYSRPKTNVQFWTAKIERNQFRDSVVTAMLESAGWQVLTIWECQLKKSQLASTMDELAETLRTNRTKYLARLEARRQERLERAAASKRTRTILASIKNGIYPLH